MEHPKFMHPKVIDFLKIDDEVSVPFKTYYTFIYE